MLVLGIETTCDETACSVVQSGKKVLSNVISSQIGIHKNYGGVYPELASRSHVDNLISIIDESLKVACVSLEEIELIAASRAPGLLGSIIVGLNSAKALSLSLNIPFVGVNHVEAHIYAAMMSKQTPFEFPSLGLVISGGHTFIVKIHSIGSYELLGTTVDDALGEAFDKVGHLLGLPYPGGPEIELLARHGDPGKFPFKAGVVKGKPYHFSFSGIKTNVLYTLKGPNSTKDSPLKICSDEKKDVAAAFQKTVFQDLIKKTLLAAAEHNCHEIFIGGGVSSSQTLRVMFDQASDGNYKIYYPAKGLSLDNGAMIAGLGYHVYSNQGSSDPLDLEAHPRLPL